MVSRLVAVECGAGFLKGSWAGRRLPFRAPGACGCLSPSLDLLNQNLEKPNQNLEKPRPRPLLSQSKSSCVSSTHEQGENQEPERVSLMKIGSEVPSEALILQVFLVSGSSLT